MKNIPHIFPHPAFSVGNQGGIKPESHGYKEHRPKGKAVYRKKKKGKKQGAHHGNQPEKKKRRFGHDEHQETGTKK